MKKLKLLLILALVICISATIVACNKTVKFKIDFIVDDEIYQTLDTSGNEVIQMPEDPTKDGYAFDGWYWNKDLSGKPFTANSLLDAPLSSNMAVYAKFSHMHSDGDWELTATIAATEDEEGNNTYRCKVCGETKKEIIEKLEHTHNYANWKYDETWHWRECLKDGEKTEITEHTYGDWKITIAPTCTQNGLRERVCTICGRKAEEDVSAKGHTEVVDNAVDPTCTEIGLTEGKHCSVCGTVIVAQQEVKKRDHTYDDGVITKEATEFEYGKKRYTCTACGHYYEVDTPKLIIDRTGAELISANGFTIDDNNCSISLPNTTTVYSFIKQITVSDYATWTISTDIYGINNVATKTVSLNAGDNVVYLLITSGDGNNINLYTMTIRRRPIYRVNFVTNGGTSVNAQNVEETYLATEPTTMRAGYTFVKWSYDFTKPIMKDETVSASWRANLDTAYKEEYYLQNLEDDDYTLIATDNLTGTTDTTARAEIKSFEHFTYNSAKSTISGNINGNGNLVLKVYYMRDKYDYSVSTENEKAETINCTANGNYKYDTTISLSATVNAGYDFVGWFDGENKISDKLNYEFKLTKNISIAAKWYIHTDTAYKTEYYLQNLEDDNYTLTATDDLTGTTDTTANAVLKPFEHFTYNSAKSTIKGNIDGNGNLVLKVYYTRDTYTVSVSAGDNVSITNAISGTYKYGYEYPGSVATFNNYLAYEWSGWHVNGVKTYDDFELNAFIVSRNSVITAQSKLKDGMQNFNFTTDETTCIINGVKDKTVTDITVPDCVTEINNAVFEDCTKLISITLPFVGASKTASNGYDQVFGYIFGYTTTNSSSTISGATYQYDKDKTYYHYYIPSSLKSVKITGGDIHYYAFHNCSGLLSITIGNGVKSIGERAFYDCRGLSSVIIGNGVTCIGDSAFYNCNGLVKITLPFVGAGENAPCGKEYQVFGYIFGFTTKESTGATCQYIYEYYDSYSRKYKYIKYYFYIPSSLRSVTITGGIIGYEVFNDCYGLTSITIGNSVTSIGKRAFSFCTGLTSVTISDSVTSIDVDAFYYCNNLTNIYYTGDIVGWCKGISGLNNIMSSSRTLYIGEDKVEGDLVIPDSVTSIGCMAFYECTGLTSITIPDSVTSIGNSAFYGCSGLTSITIPDSVTSIGEDVFYWCSGLTSVTIGNGVTSIGEYAFYGCSGLTSVTIGNAVTSIGEYVFSGCSGLTSITIPDSVTSIGEYAFYGCSGLTSVTIGNAVTSIGEYVFSGCSGLTSITIPDSVTSIGAHTFSECSGLTNVTIPDSVTSIEDFAFKFCSGLTSVTIGNAVTSIGEYVFSGCSGLTSITIPDSVTSIGWGAFGGCSGLTSATIGNGVKSIGERAFSDCNRLTSINVSENNSSYKSINGNLYSKDGKTLVRYAIGKTDSSFTIPDSVTSIGDNAFYNCSGLTSITIPASVTSIGEYAFSGCRGLTSIEYGGTIEQWQAISKNAYWNLDMANYVIYCTDVTITK